MREESEGGRRGQGREEREERVREESEGGRRGQGRRG